MTVSIPCSWCHGKGRISLSDDMLKVLDAVQNNGPISAGELRKIVGKSFVRTAANNRLERLRRHGLIKRKLKGNVWNYECCGRSD